MGTDLKNIDNVYLIGIGGIGMSGLARYFNRLGCRVAGYDRTPTGLTQLLEEEGIGITYKDNVSTIEPPFNSSDFNERTLIIYTPAVPKNSLILNFFMDMAYQPQKRSQVLGLLSQNMFTIAVAGTHGKTTTSSMIAHVLKHSGYDCSAFLGGIAANYNSNVLFGSNNTMVVEADEFDRSFLTLHPDIAIITSMDADHLDIYGDHKHLEESFRLFARQLHANGLLIKREGLNIGRNAFEYAVEPKNPVDAFAENIRIKDGKYIFDYQSKQQIIKDIGMSFPGRHNVENAVAAIAAALALNIEPQKIKSALEAFKGVKRRFEYIINQNNLVFIDDYAHHPEELKATLNAVKQLYPGKKLTVLFQPHLFTRTRDFADGFAQSLSLADKLLLLDIYPARELPIVGVTSKIIFDKVTLPEKVYCSKEEVFEHITAENTEVLLTVGAGDIDKMVEPLKKQLLK